MSKSNNASFTHEELKKLVIEGDKGYPLLLDEKRAVENHLMKCKSCDRMLLKRHVRVDVIRK